MAALSGEQVAQILAQAGFKGEQLVEMVAIAKRESGWTPEAHRTNNPKRNDVGDFGLTQINYTNVPTLVANHVINNVQDLLDPVKNAKAAYFLSKNGTNLSPWNATVGVGYDPNGKPLAGAYLNAARAAVANAQAQGVLGMAYVGAGAPLGAGQPTCDQLGRRNWSPHLVARYRSARGTARRSRRRLSSFVGTRRGRRGAPTTGRTTGRSIT